MLSLLFVAQPYPHFHIAQQKTPDVLSVAEYQEFLLFHIHIEPHLEKFIAIRRAFEDSKCQTKDTLYRIDSTFTVPVVNHLELANPKTANLLSTGLPVLPMKTMSWS